MLKALYKDKLATLDKFTITKKIDKFNEVISINENLEFYKDDYKELYKDAITLEGFDNVSVKDKCETEIIGISYDNEGSFDTKNCIAKKPIDFNKELRFKDSYNIFDYDVLTIQSIQGSIDRQFQTSNLTALNPEMKIDSLMNLLGLSLAPIDGYYVEYIKISAIPIFFRTIITPPIFENGVLKTEGSYLETYIVHNISADVHRVKQISSTQIEGWLYDVANQVYYKPFPLLDLNVTYDYKFQTSPILELKLSATFEAGRVNKYRQGSISNIRSFKDLIDSLFDANIVSNFFNVNPDATNPNNYYYEFSEKYCRNIGIGQSYDIIRASALQDSFGISGDFNAEKLIEDINTYFNTIFVYYPEDDIIRYEHVSYFNSKGIEPDNYIIDDIEFNKSLIKSEKWSQAQTTKDPRHNQTVIRYKNINGIEDKTYKVELLLTDFGEIWENKEYEKDQYQKSFVILSLDSNNTLIDYNDLFSINALVSNLHDLNRPSRVGFQDEKPTQFKTKNLGITSSVEIDGNLDLLKKLHVYNSVKLKEGVFRIEEIELNDSYKLKLKINK